MKIDWIAAALTWIGNLILIQKKPWWVFGIFFIANCLWVVYWLPQKEYAATLLTFSFAIQNIWGLRKWRNEIQRSS